jgi:hypothetical protein
MAGRQLLSQLGQEDIVLSGKPEITFFKEAYPSQGLYASRVIDVPFKNVPTFGDEVSTEIPLNGDLMTSMYLAFTFGTNLGVSFNAQAGILMIDYVELYSGTELIERLWGEYIGILNECQIPTSKQAALTSIIGGGTPTSTFTPANWSMAPFKFTVPLPFQCLRHGLPLVPGMNFRISLNPPSSFLSGTSIPSFIPSMQFNFYTEFVVLSEPEKNFIKNRGPVIYLGESIEIAQFDVTNQSANVRCVTDFLHPVKEIFFTIRNSSSIAPDYWFDYSNTAQGGTSSQYWSNTYSNINQLNSMGIYFEGIRRVDPLWATSIYLGTTQFIDYHTRVPTKPFYMYSFSLDPENPKPAGSVNLGRIKNQYFDFFLQPMPSWRSPSDRILTIWARHYTFLEINGFKTIKNLFDGKGDNGYLVYLP